jgi:hypothetical protein
MPRIAQVDLVQVNNQVSRIDQLEAQLKALQKQSSSVGQQTIVADSGHAPATSNNLNFTWTGGTTTLSWTPGYIKDKNWSVQTTVRPAAKSSAPGQKHMFPVTSGNLVLAPSTYYWIGWDYVHNVMRATTDASSLHNNYNVHIVCQLFTGTGGQTGTAGGGGSQGGVDLSGARYKNF